MSHFRPQATALLRLGRATTTDPAATATATTTATATPTPTAYTTVHPQTYAVSVGNKQPYALMYPETGRAEGAAGTAADEAVNNVQVFLTWA